MQYMNITANNSLCLKDCFQGMWDPYFDSHYHRYIPTDGTLLTISVVSLLATTVFCGMNCCCPMPCKKERSPFVGQPLQMDDENEELPLIDPPPPPPKTTSKAVTICRIVGGLVVSGVAVGAACWGLSWYSQQSLTSPLLYASDLLVRCYKNCTALR